MYVRTERHFGCNRLKLKHQPKFSTIFNVKKLEARFCKEYYLRYRVTFNVADNLILNLNGCYFRQANPLEAESILAFISCPRKTQKCLQAAALSE